MRRQLGAPLLLLLACARCSTGGDSSGAAGHSGATAAAGGDSGASNDRGGSSGSSSGGAGAGGGVAQGAGGSSGSGMAGSSGTSGSAGESVGGGSAGGAAGSGGAGASTGGSGAGSGGERAGAAGDGSAGTGGSGFPIAGDNCRFAVEHTQSTAIGTVTIVTWSTDLEGLSEAHIDFGPTDADGSMTAPVDLAREGYRTLLLGMKPAKSYGFKIVATGASETCTSPTFDVTTAPLPDTIPTITKTEGLPGGVRGFFLATPGVGSGTVAARTSAFVFDTDGDIVWWSPDAAGTMSSARMSWDGQWMWIVNANGGALYKTSMDGLVSDAFGGVATANHDVVPLPEGGVATFGRVENKHALIEVHDDGTVETIVMLEDVYQLDGSYHPNALAYQPADDTFTISDLELDGFVKIQRDGELIWQLGGTSPLGQSFDLVGLEPWNGNHGHDLGPDGQFVFFNNFPNTGGSTIIELVLDEQAWTATKTWDYELTNASLYLGGTQRLPNGNTSVVHSQGDRVHEVNGAGEIVQSFSHSAFNAEMGSQYYAVFGYVHFRPTLYGPPPSTWPE